MDINHIKSSLKSILPEGYSDAVLSWLEALQEWSDDDLVTITNHPIQLDGPSDMDKGDTIAIGDIFVQNQNQSETGQPIPTIGAYEDLGFLGKGGMGEVRLVRDRKLNRRLAMKILHPHLLSRRITTSRFIEEAQVCAQLEHPNIVPIHDFGTLPDGRLYFTMKEIKGRSLDTIIWSVHNAVRDGKFQPTQDGWSFRRLIDVFHQVCFAVGYAHSKGVLHRDLKPSNIMIGKFGEVLVVDWGIAKVLGRHDLLVDAGRNNTVQSSMEDADLTRIGQVIGTPAYMAPEQARGDNDQLGPETDVYALGAMLYKILTGHSAYPGTKMLDLLEKVRNESPKPIASLLNGRDSNSVSLQQLPMELIQACEKAMSRQKEDRFATAMEFEQVILSWLEGAKKTEQAMAILEQTAPLETRIRKLSSESRGLMDTARKGLNDIPSWESEKVKSKYWQKEAKARSNKQEAERLDLKVEQLLQAALTHRSDLEAAHEILVRRYMQSHQLAEREYNVKDTAYAEIHLKHHANELPESNETRHRAFHYLKGIGAVSLKTDVPGVDIYLEQYVPHHRRLVPKPIAHLGSKPLYEHSLEMGSYRLILKKEGHHEVKYPVFIGRGEHWDGCDLHGFQRPVHLPKLGALHKNECFVPAGWFLCGGDQNAFRSYGRKRLWLDDVVMSRFQITNRAYLAFLNALIQDGREEDALRWVPREMAGTVNGHGAILYHRNSEGLFELGKNREDTAWELDWPVMRISWYSAMAYAQWWSEQTGLGHRLPNELEWEKSARGVDGRWYVWGNEFDSSYCCMAGSLQGELLPSGINDFPIDESVYGVRGMAGNMCDWGIDKYRLDWDEDYEDKLKVYRGGSWRNDARSCRIAYRYSNYPQNRSTRIGIRLCRSLDSTVSKKRAFEESEGDQTYRVAW